MKPATKIAVVLLSMVAVAHLLRMIFGLEVLVGTWPAPMWISLLGVLVPGGLAYMMVKEHKA